MGQAVAGPVAGANGGRPVALLLARADGPVVVSSHRRPSIQCGWALAEFLQRKYGTERFLQLYFACRPGHFEAECEAHLGVGLDNLESGFWEEVDRLAGNQ